MFTGVWYMCVCVCVFVSMWRPGLHGGTQPYAGTHALPFYSQSRVSYAQSSATWLVLASLLYDSLVCLLRLNYKLVTILTWHLCGFWESKLGFHDHKANANEAV